jgi:hypothetical protein
MAFPDDELYRLARSLVELHASYETGLHAITYACRLVEGGWSYTARPTYDD